VGHFLWAVALAQNKKKKKTQKKKSVKKMATRHSRMSLILPQPRAQHWLDPYSIHKHEPSPASIPEPAAHRT
jgi:hypothetical protein